jgi:hypothetical protein
MVNVALFLAKMVQNEEGRRRERQAYDLAQQARGASRVGRAFVPGA